MRNNSNEQSRRAALHLVTLVAALAVGILIGRSTCSPEPETVVEKEIVERTPDCPPCEADTGVPDTSVDAVIAASPDPPEDKGNRPMPEAPGPPDPELRRRLLSWVRDQAPGLRRCRPGGGSTIRLAVTLTLGEEGGVESADINAPDEELEDDELQCLRRRMRQWTPPEDLVEGRQRVVFGLDL